MFLKLFQFFLPNFKTTRISYTYHDKEKHFQHTPFNNRRASNRSTDTWIHAENWLQIVKKITNIIILMPLFCLRQRCYALVVSYQNDWVWVFKGHHRYYVWSTFVHFCTSQLIWILCVSRKNVHFIVCDMVISINNNKYWWYVIVLISYVFVSFVEFRVQIHGTNLFNKIDEIDLLNFSEQSNEALLIKSTSYWLTWLKISTCPS